MSLSLHKFGSSLKMHDLIFKNLTSFDRKKRVLLAFERFNKDGVFTEKERKFIYLIREVSSANAVLDPPQLFVVKSVDSKTLQERFFCKIKASLYVQNEKKLFLVRFRHSIRIKLFNNLPEPS
ncbi:MAG: hypothetical protein AAB740_04920 [Patescibacteria group bacterium]